LGLARKVDGGVNNEEEKSIQGGNVRRPGQENGTLPQGGVVLGEEEEGGKTKKRGDGGREEGGEVACLK